MSAADCRMETGADFLGASSLVFSILFLRRHDLATGAHLLAEEWLNGIGQNDIVTGKASGSVLAASAWISVFRRMRNLLLFSPH
jgi:hypothetical protein